MRITWIATVALAAALVGCGSVADSPNDGGIDVAAGDFTLSADPASLTLPIASSATVTLSVVRGGSVGDISLSLGTLPANLTAALAVDVLPAGAETTELTVTALGGVAPAVGTFEISATAGSVTHTATVSVSTTTINVAGMVRGGNANVTVGIVGKSSVVTGTGGTFAFADVTPPYDLYVVGSVGFSPATPSVNVYQGLTTATPVATQPFTPLIPFGLCQIGTTCQAVSGSQTGGNNADPMMVAWSIGGGTVTPNGSYSFTARGFSDAAPTRTGTLYALQYAKDANAVPTSFSYGTAAATLTRASSNPGKTINVSPLTTTKAMSGTIVLPPGFATPKINLYQELASTVLSYDTIATTTINGVVPNIGTTGFGTSLFVTASLAGTSTSFVHPLKDAANDLNVTLPTPAALTAPVADATNVSTSTPFSWTGEDNAIFEVAILGPSIQFQIFTPNKQLTIPVISGFALPVSSSFAWRVTTYAKHASANDAAATLRLETARPQDFEGPARADSYSVSRNFQSAPQ